MNNSGFTLVEMLVVITIISLMGLTIIPTVIGMFNSGADSQSYAMLTTELSAARTLAIKTSSYVCVHIQQANADVDPGIPASINGKVYMAVLIRSPLQLTDPASPYNISYFYPDQVFATGTLAAASTSSALIAQTTGNGSAVAWVANQWSGYWVRMISGAATGQTAQIVASNLASNGLQLSGSFSVTPAASDYFMIYKPTNLEPQVLPGTIAFGRLTIPPIMVSNGAVLVVSPGQFVVNGAFQGAALGNFTADAGNSQLGQSFMTVNIVFSPTGTLVTTTPDSNYSVNFATTIPGTTSPLPGYFYDDPNAIANNIYTKIWPMPASSAAASNYYTKPLYSGAPTSVPTAVNLYDGVHCPQPGTHAVTIVDYMRFLRLTGTGAAPNRYSYLNSDNGGCPYLSVNTNTGAMLPRK